MKPGRHKSTVALILALLLAVTSYNMATVRGASAVAGQITLCIGDTIEVVYVDADGAPTSAPHLCTECILAFAPALYGISKCARETTVSVNRGAVPKDKVVSPDVVSGFKGRAPPSRVS